MAVRCPPIDWDDQFMLPGLSPEMVARVRKILFAGHRVVVMEGESRTGDVVDVRTHHESGTPHFFVVKAERVGEVRLRLWLPKEEAK